jgi:hypothetical protein
MLVPSDSITIACIFVSFERLTKFLSSFVYSDRAYVVAKSSSNIKVIQKRVTEAPRLDELWDEAYLSCQSFIGVVPLMTSHRHISGEPSTWYHTCQNYFVNVSFYW